MGVLDSASWNDFELARQGHSKLAEVNFERLVVHTDLASEVDALACNSLPFDLKLEVTGLRLNDHFLREIEARDSLEGLIDFHLVLGTESKHL